MGKIYETACKSEVISVCKIRLQFDLPCQDCKYNDSKYCKKTEDKKNGNSKEEG